MVYSAKSFQHSDEEKGGEMRENVICMFQTRSSCAYRLEGVHTGLRSSQPQKDAGAGVVDRKISKLHELREKELAYKDNYTIFDEMFMCFRCLFD